MNAATIVAGTASADADPPDPDDPRHPDDALPLFADDLHEEACDVAAGGDAGARPAPAPGPLPADAEMARWIAAVVERDERALAALYDATFSRVYGLALRIVRRAPLAEEVVEDTFFQVWRQAPRFDPTRGNALAWLMAMTRSRAIDAMRRETRFQHDPLDDAPAHEPVADAASVDEWLDLARHRVDLQQALLRLGAQPRQLVSLAFFRGLSHEEIAQHAGLPLGTVKSQIRRALAALRQILGEAGGAMRASWPAATDSPRHSA